MPRNRIAEAAPVKGPFYGSDLSASFLLAPCKHLGSRGSHEGPTGPPEPVNGSLQAAARSAGRPSRRPRRLAPGPAGDGRTAGSGGAETAGGSPLSGLSHGKFDDHSKRGFTKTKGTLMSSPGMTSRLHPPGVRGQGALQRWPHAAVRPSAPRGGRCASSSEQQLPATSGGSALCTSPRPLEPP